jgi:glycosyltransferase involved in cell wall biosynthesis
VLLYVGRISKEKDLDVIVKTWSRLKEDSRLGEMADWKSKLEKCRLAFVGDGPFLPELRTFLPDAIFTGYLAGLELARAYASSDIFLFPSTTDTFGNVIIESLASGLPCVVSDQGGPKDLIQDCVTGLVTHALDVADFTDSTARLISDPKLRHAMSVEAHRSVQDRDWAEAGQRFWSAK